MKIRFATLQDLDAIIEIEDQCFPQNEAATKESFEKRLHAYPDHFWLLEIKAHIVGYINGMMTDALTISDEMFENAGLHNETGHWQSIFGVAVLPEYQNKGYAAKIMERVIFDSKIKKHTGCILTCKDKLIHYYEKFGFINYGVSQSRHGGETWYDMRLEFNPR